METTVFAVIVTYNRLQYLPLVVEALKAQTRPVQGIVVVNNGSTDNTRNWLDEQPTLHAVHQTNVGGAGGFKTGVSTALSLGADWVWMMDDDVVPVADCLEILLRYSAQSACLHPLRIEPDGSLQDEERWFDPADCRLVSLNNASVRNGKEIWFRNTGSFEGMLVARWVVDKIGLPDERFFICHDDLAYGLLASQHTNVAVVSKALMHRQPVAKTQDSLYAYEYYYMLRNLWLLEEYADALAPGLTAYRRRRIHLRFWYAVYKIFRVDKPANKRQALALVRLAWRHYKQRRGGMK